MSAREFYYWAAFDQLSPIGDDRNDIHAAQIASATYQSQGVKVSLSDCLIKFNEPAEQQDDVEQFLNNLAGE